MTENESTKLNVESYGILLLASQGRKQKTHTDRQKEARTNPDQLQNGIVPKTGCPSLCAPSLCLHVSAPLSLRLLRVSSHALSRRAPSLRAPVLPPNLKDSAGSRCPFFGAFSVPLCPFFCTAQKHYDDSVFSECAPLSVPLCPRLKNVAPCSVPLSPFFCAVVLLFLYRFCPKTT